MRPLLILSLLFTVGCAERQAISDVKLNRLDGTATHIVPSETFFTVIYFLSPECPLCINYTLAMDQLEKRFASDSIKFIGVHSQEWFTADEVREYQLKYHLGFEMLLDNGNQLAKSLGATITPEAFILNRNSEILYSGKIDNWVNDLGKKKLEVSEDYLENALVAALDGKKIKPNRTKPIGCLIE